MRIVRFRNDRNVKLFGILKNDTIRAIEGDIFNIHSDTGVDIPLNKVKLLAPIPHPNKIIGVGLNYKKHIKEWVEKTGKTYDEVLSKNIILFLKPPTGRIGHNGEIELPEVSNKVEYEGELAVVIGKECKNVSKENALSFVFGYTCANDVTARDIQESDGQWTRAKGFDSFCPLGPVITLQKNFELITGFSKILDEAESKIDTPNNLRIKTYLNSKVVQDFYTSDMIYSVEEIIEFASSVMTLFPGDVVLTGTGLGTGQIASGDIVEVEIEKIGKLSNRVK